MLVLFLLFVVAPLVELYVIIQVAQVIGGWETIALIVVESLVGAWLFKRQGRATLTKISQALDAGRLPSNELVDGLLLMVAGALMLAPGFISDLLAWLLIIPPTRLPFRHLVLRRFRRGDTGWFFAAANSGSATRFVGSFRPGGTVYDTTGHAATTPHGELEP
ncbi:MAG: FxsA family protein [Acidimicrobiales bacterium]